MCMWCHSLGERPSDKMFHNSGDLKRASFSVWISWQSGLKCKAKCTGKKKKKESFRRVPSAIWPLKKKPSRWCFGPLLSVAVPPTAVRRRGWQFAHHTAPYAPPCKPRHFHYSVIWNYQAPVMDWQGWMTPSGGWRRQQQRLLAHATSCHAKAREALAKCLAKRGPTLIRYKYWGVGPGRGACEGDSLETIRLR